MFRRTRRSALICAALLCGAHASSAQTADDIIAKNLAAKGGVERLRETSSVRITGTITLQGLKGTTLTMSKRPNMFRRETDLGGQKMIQAYDGRTIWMQRSGMPAQEVPPGPQAEMLKGDVDFDSAFLDWQQKGHKVDYKGTVTEGGRQFHRLIFTAKDRPPAEYFIDVNTGLEARVVVTMEEPGSGKGRLETRFTDYRDVDGRMIPFVTTNLMNGAQIAQIRLDKVEFNVPFDDALFRMPSKLE